jgi:hypothetical protein
MFSPFVFLTLLGLLASQALAVFNITVGKTNLITSQILDIPDSAVTQACTSNCSIATSSLASCQDDASCLCGPATVDSLVDCETCMLHYLIATNKPAPDFRAGSNPVVQAYAASCKGAGIVLAANQSALTLPDNWDGPFVAVLPLGGTAVTVAVGAILGVSALLILSNLS